MEAKGKKGSQLLELQLMTTDSSPLPSTSFPIRSRSKESFHSFHLRIVISGKKLPRMKLYRLLLLLALTAGCFGVATRSSRRRARTVSDSDGAEEPPAQRQRNVRPESVEPEQHAPMDLEDAEVVESELLQSSVGTFNNGHMVDQFWRMDLPKRLAIPYTYTVWIRANPLHSNDPMNIFNFADLFRNIVSDPRVSCRADKVPDWFTTASRQTESLRLSSKFLRLAYWIVGDLPFGWHLELASFGEKHLVLFVESRTGRRSTIDPRLERPLPDLGFVMRDNLFRTLQSRTVLSESIDFNLGVRSNYTRSALDILYQEVEYLYMAVDIHVKVENETGVDGGGLSREFFDEISSVLFNPALGLFQETETHALEISALPANSEFKANAHLDVFDDFDLYYRAGLFLGLCLRTGHNIPVFFTSATYAQLLGRAAEFEDLQQSDPDLYRNFQWTLYVMPLSY